jgi:hypothetical protein
VTDVLTSDTLPDQTPAKRPVGRPRKGTSSAKPPRDTKPRAKPTAPATGSKPTGRPSNDRRARDSVERAVSLGGLLLSVLNQEDGRIVIEAAPALAAEVVEIAKGYPAVYAMLVDTSKGTPWFRGATIVGLGIALPIAANHGVSILDKLPPVARLMLEGMRAKVIEVEDKPDLDTETGTSVPLDPQPAGTDVPTIQPLETVSAPA